MNDLRKKLMAIFDRYWADSLPSDQFADEVLVLLKKEGWKSEEEVMAIAREAFQEGTDR